MIWNEHSELTEQHAFLSPSTPTFLRYSQERLAERFISQYSQKIGTVLHEYARNRIKRAKEYPKKNFKLTRYSKNEAFLCLLDAGVPDFAIDIDSLYPNLMTYVNDAIDYKMDPEIKLVHSEHCFGTTDAISYENGYLRIHDLKTGTTPAHIEQLLTYAALFCFEKKVKPTQLTGTELRIYQNNEVLMHNPSPEDIQEIMNIIDWEVKFINRKFYGGD